MTGTQDNSPARATDATEVARAVASELAKHLTDVVICPGSRNAPLSLALIAQPGIRVHTRLDLSLIHI